MNTRSRGGAERMADLRRPQATRSTATSAPGSRSNGARPKATTAGLRCAGSSRRPTTERATTWSVSTRSTTPGEMLLANEHIVDAAGGVTELQSPRCPTTAITIQIVATFDMNASGHVTGWISLRRRWSGRP